MSRGVPSPPPSPGFSPLTVPDSPCPSPPELIADHALHRPPPTLPSVPDAAPCALRGDVTPEFDVPAVAACPICLLAPSSEPEAEDTAFPCCNAFTHLSCLVRCAQLHGTCPNCRAAIDHLSREPGIAARCQALGINMHAANISAPDTAVAVARDYAMRTFSRADAVEPREPIHIRAACCNRLAGPALDFAELPDTRMHWTPLPRRGTEGIEAWLPQWMCMRCQNELRLERICVPDPTPSCPVCLTPMLWEVDCARRQERWACSRCPLALRPVPPCRSPDLPTHAPPALGPPALPLRDGTNSALYVPLLLDAAGMLSAEGGGAAGLALARSHQRVVGCRRPGFAGTGFHPRARVIRSCRACRPSFRAAGSALALGYAVPGLGRSAGRKRHVRPN